MQPTSSPSAPVDPPLTPLQFQELEKRRMEEQRNGNFRRLLWSARNHLQAAQAKVEGQYDARDLVTPSESVGPFVRQEIAIHTGTAALYFLKALIMSDPEADPAVPQQDIHDLFRKATRQFQNVALHEKAIKKVNRTRNRAIHDGIGPDRVTAIRNFLAAEEFADCVVRELRRAGSPFIAEFNKFDSFQESEAASRAIGEWESDVQARISAAAALYASKTAGRDADEVAALLELDREGWLAAADPVDQYVDHDCPACGSNGFAILEVEYVDVGDVQASKYTHAVRFFCVACGLDLAHADWPFAGITDIYSDPDPDLFET